MHTGHPADCVLQVAAILARGSMCERASIDEAYLDLTDAANRLLQQQQQQQQHGPTSSSCSSLDGGAVGAAAAAAAVGPGAGLVAPGPPPSVPRCLEGWHVLGLEVRGSEACLGRGGIGACEGA